MQPLSGLNGHLRMLTQGGTAVLPGWQCAVRPWAGVRNPVGVAQAEQDACLYAEKHHSGTAWLRAGELMVDGPDGRLVAVWQGNKKLKLRKQKTEI